MEKLYNNPHQGYHRATPKIAAGVVEIEDYQFSNCKDLTSMIIPEGVKRIGDFAFHNCINLTSVVLPQSLEQICAGAFFGCQNLRSINIPTSLREIGMVAFSGCNSLKKVVLTENVQVGNGAFNLCGNLEVLMQRPKIGPKKSTFMTSMMPNIKNAPMDLGKEG